MQRIYRNPNQQGDYADLFKRCDACGMWVKVKRTPSGGEWALTTRDAVTSDLILPANGCPFCLSPAWDNGGKLGDLARCP